VNDKLFFSFTGVLNLRFDALITLKPSNYTLDTLTTHLAELFSSTLATAPPWVKLNFIPSVMSNPSMGRIYINNVKRDVLLDEGWRFYIWSDEDIQKESFFTAWRGGIYNVMYPGSCNRLLKNFATQTNSFSNGFRSGFIDLLNHHTIYIRSAQLGTFQNIGPQGERDILKKIMVSVPFGSLITDTLLQTEDFTDCSRLSLKTLHFRVTDVYGYPLNMHGHHISFSLVFSSAQ
jgi:hypothetical protein